MALVCKNLGSVPESSRGLNTDVYLGLGGNIGDTEAIFIQGLRRIASLESVWNLEVSSLYQTEAVGTLLPQRDYLNAVCRFETTLSLRHLARALAEIEVTLGKQPKPKSDPRMLDIDILFFGCEYEQETDLQVPHPSWRERRFVLDPLADLVHHLLIPVSKTETEWVNVLDLLKSCSQFAVKPISCSEEFCSYRIKIGKGYGTCKN